MELNLSRFAFYAALTAGLLWAFVVVFLEARRRRAPWGLIGVAGLTAVCGLGVGLLGGAHLVGVIMGAVARGEAFDYDFRFYSLVLLGALIFLPGFVCVFFCARARACRACRLETRSRVDSLSARTQRAAHLHPGLCATPVGFGARKLGGSARRPALLPPDHLSRIRHGLTRSHRRPAGV